MCLVSDCLTNSTVCLEKSGRTGSDYNTLPRHGCAGTWVGHTASQPQGAGGGGGGGGDYTHHYGNSSQAGLTVGGRRDDLFTSRLEANPNLTGKGHVSDLNYRVRFLNQVPHLCLAYS